MARTDEARFRTNWQEEVDAAATYGALAKMEAIDTLAEVYRRLAAAEEAHIGFWENKLRDAGVKVPARLPSVRSRVTVWLARRFGTQSVIPTLTMKEQAGRHGYDDQPDAIAANLPVVEHSHARLLSTISRGPSSGMEEGLPHAWRAATAPSGNAAARRCWGQRRPGLGPQPGDGVAGATRPTRRSCRRGGGTLAGACVMAMGEWLAECRELATAPDRHRARRAARAPRNRRSLHLPGEGPAEGGGRRRSPPS
jgi:hypothetical protein